MNQTHQLSHLTHTLERLDQMIGEWVIIDPTYVVPEAHCVKRAAELTEKYGFPCRAVPVTRPTPLTAEELGR